MTCFPVDLSRTTLCADDYALSPAVSRGILELLEAGKINATSVMSNRPSWPESAAALRPFRGTAQIGLHLNLTCGEALTDFEGLARDGKLPELRRFIQNFVPKNVLEAEICAQIDAFIAHFGAPPDYLDGHQHVHVLKSVRAPLFAALETSGLAGKLWLRNSADKVWRILARGVEVKKALMVKALAHGFAAEARARGYALNEGFSGFSAFDVKRDYGADFARYLRAPGTKHLIMCHPGYVDDELRAADFVTEARVKELMFLSGW